MCHPASRQNNKGHPAYLGSGGHVANRRGSWLIGDNFHAAIIGPHDTNSSSNALRFLQIERVEPFSEPPVNRRKQFARLLRLPCSRQRRARLMAARSSQCLRTPHALALARFDTVSCQRLKWASFGAIFMSAKRPPMSIPTRAVMSAIVKRSQATNSCPSSS